MKIGVFVYNWSHWKSQAGLLNLILNDFTPDCVFGADPVELKFYKSKIRIGPKDLFLHHPAHICSKFNVDYRVVVHNSDECTQIIKEKKLDVGIILGARILKQHVIDSFNMGIINMHPGLLPENRGLDNLKWALIKKIPQGVTSHFIDNKIDKGALIDMQKIKIYKDDTLLDIHLRLQNKEQEMMIDALKNIQEPEFKLTSLKKLGSGDTYHRSVTPELEKDLHLYLNKYVEKFGE